ncbi:transporter [Zafaria cholistanensis]|uniref:Transporter n=1 Tax=Zafaria cholistanensis TaxID=1682741 RepID=A0A5A7NNL5_9MICC|nr:SulP family inorganic anion transporter [Zafaria cholistanensis]GER22209.1 transporter [Zafaria cholistanensis]
MAGRWLHRTMPGVASALSYRRSWLGPDLAAGVALSTVLVPAGMAYAAAAGLPPETGLYATIVPLLAYAVFGPSRVLVLGPDSSLAPMIAAAVLPLALGSDERAVALAGLLALLTGCFLLLGRMAGMGFITSLLSKPIRVGYLNGVALVVLVGQAPKLLGIEGTGGNIIERLAGTVRAVAEGQTNLAALALGGGALLVIVASTLLGSRIPGLLPAVAASMAATALLGWEETVPVAGPLPSTLPAPALGGIGPADVWPLLGPAAGIALITFADTTALSRALAGRSGERVDGGQEMAALGAAEVASGLLGGFPVSGSTSRTPVAVQSGARTQLAMVVAAVLVAAFMLLLPGLTRYLPQSVLAAVVMAAALWILDLGTLRRLARRSPVEAALLLAALLGVAFVGVLEGIAVAVALSLAVFVWQAWNPHRTELVRVEGIPGFHDAFRHPEGRRIPGLVIARFDAPLFFANGSVFTDHVRALVDRAPGPVRWAVVAAEPLTGIDSTAADELAALDEDLARDGVRLAFAEMKGPVKDRLARLEPGGRFAPERFYPTLHSAVRDYLDRHPEANGY